MTTESWELVNLSPHRVTILRTDGTRLGLPPCATPPRVVDNEVGPDRALDLSAGGRARLVHYGRTGSIEPALPTPVPGVLFVVARTVAEAADGRGDLVFPCDFVRDQAGVIIAAGALGTIAGVGAG